MSHEAFFFTALGRRLHLRSIVRLFPGTVEMTRRDR